MKKLIGLLVLVSSVGNAAFVPASVTKQNQASQLMDIRESTAKQIELRASAGYHFVCVDMDGADWKTENIIMKELQALGYNVKITEDSHVYGWNNVNGALLIKW